MSEWTPEEIEQLKKICHDGISLQRAAVRLKKSSATIMSVAKELGLPPPKSRAELRRTYGMLSEETLKRYRTKPSNRFKAEL